MIFVVDTNIIVSAILRPALTQELVFSSDFELFAPEYVKNEMADHKSEFLKKSGYSEHQFELIVALVFSKITIIPASEYEKYRTEVLEFVPDKDDWPFFALARHLDSALWSNDVALKKKQTRIRVLNTEDIISIRR